MTDTDSSPRKQDRTVILPEPELGNRIVITNTTNRQIKVKFSNYWWWLAFEETGVFEAFEHFDHAGQQVRVDWRRVMEAPDPSQG